MDPVSGWAAIRPYCSSTWKFLRASFKCPLFLLSATMEESSLDRILGINFKCSIYMNQKSTIQVLLSSSETTWLCCTRIPTGPISTAKGGSWKSQSMSCKILKMGRLMHQFTLIIPDENNTPYFRLPAKDQAMCPKNQELPEHLNNFLRNDVFFSNYSRNEIRIWGEIWCKTSFFCNKMPLWYIR